VAHRDQASQRRLEERRRLGFLRGVESGSGDLVARGAVSIRRNDVQQITGHAGVSKVGGDACAHGAGAENGDSINALHQWMAPGKIIESRLMKRSEEHTSELQSR